MQDCGNSRALTMELLRSCTMSSICWPTCCFTCIVSEQREVTNQHCEREIACHWYCWDALHDDVIKWKHFPRNWPFAPEIHRSPVNSPHKSQWHGALMFSLICVWINDWANNREAGDLRSHRGHYDVIVMPMPERFSFISVVVQAFFSLDAVKWQLTRAYILYY